MVSEQRIFGKENSILISYKPKVGGYGTRFG